MKNEQVYKQIISLKRDVTLGEVKVFKDFEKLSEEIDGRVISTEEYNRLLNNFILTLDLRE